MYYNYSVRVHARNYNRVLIVSSHRETIAVSDSLVRRAFAFQGIKNPISNARIINPLLNHVS